MTTSKDHYDNLLGNFYTWTRGSFRVQEEESESFFRQHQLLPSGPEQHAIDLGCGAGAQSIALAALGYRVTAVDQCESLLAQLVDNLSEGHAVNAVENDLIAYFEDASDPASLIVCMGDTLTHLPDYSTVVRLFEECHRLLRPGGRIALTYRDLSTALEGVDRIIPGRADDQRIITCFLEYKDERVIVHDLVHERRGEEWVLHKSSYPKLRLSEKAVYDALETAGLTLVFGGVEAGMSVVIAQKVP